MEQPTEHEWNEQRPPEGNERDGEKWNGQTQGNELTGYALADWLLKTGPTCSRLLLQAGAAKTASQCTRIFRVRSGWIYLNGRLANPLRPRALEYYWSSRPSWGKLFRHNAILQNLRVGWLPEAKFFANEYDGLIPDAEFSVADAKFFLEYDAANEPHKVIKDKLEKYQGIITDENLLIVTRGPRRVSNVLLHLEGISNVCVAELEHVLADPWGKVWHLPDGDRVAINKPQTCLNIAADGQE